MKTLQEMYNEILASEELKAAFAEAARGGKALDFLKDLGCETTAEGLAAFLKEQRNGEVPDEEIESVAGGTCNQQTGAEALLSVVSLSLGCIGTTLKSAIEGHIGQHTAQEARMCTPEEKPKHNW